MRRNGQNIVKKGGREGKRRGYKRKWEQNYEDSVSHDEKIILLTFIIFRDIDAAQESARGKQTAAFQVSKTIPPYFQCVFFTSSV